MNLSIITPLSKGIGEIIIINPPYWAILCGSSSDSTSHSNEVGDYEGIRTQLLVSCFGNLKEYRTEIY